MRLFLLSFISVILFHIGYSQSAYFQQEVNYKIDVKLNDHDHTLEGFIEMMYTNNSPDVLDKIGMHLYPNAYSNHQTAWAKQMLFQYKEDFLKAKFNEMGFITNLAFTVDGNKAELLMDQKNPDMAWLSLPEALTPGKSIKISSPFHVKIPNCFSRLGHDGQNYQITQWYPKPAVYDHKGWHLMPYLDIGEFYSEFGSFDVSITLPANYIVGATGELQDEDEKLFLQQKWQDSQKAISANSALYDGNPESSTQTKTLHYRANGVHDFAWFASKTFYVEYKVATLESGKKVDCWAMHKQPGIWNKGADYIARSIQYLSKHVGEYPWPQATAIETALEAGAGMEYPMITVIGPTFDAPSLDIVLAHEIIHNWFYGIVASNERDHPYMDEGITNYYENRYAKEYYQSVANYIPQSFEKWFGEFDETQLIYLYFARNFQDQHPNQASENFTVLNYVTDVYGKTAALFDYLENYIGIEEFDRIMKTYFQKWKFKHPYPEDLQEIFSSECKKPTHWLFENYLNSDRKSDYKIQQVKKESGQLKIRIKNNRKIEAPFILSAFTNGKETSTQWIDGFLGEKEFSLPNDEYDLIALDAKLKSLELYQFNNYSRVNGSFKKIEPIHIKLLPFIEQPGKTILGISPIVGWNVNNGFMAGLHLSQAWMPSRHWNFILSPLYDFKNNQLAGQAHASFTFYRPDSKIHHLQIGIHGKRYAYEKTNTGSNLFYNQLSPFIQVQLNKIPSTLKSEFLNYTFHYIQNEIFADSNSQHSNFVHQLKYVHSKSALLGNSFWQLSVQFENQKTSVQKRQQYLRLDGEYSKELRLQKNRYAEIRLFASYFPYQSEKNLHAISARSKPDYYRGSVGLAYQNYLDQNNEYLFFSRSAISGFWSQQIDAYRQGGFKIAHGYAQRENLGNSNRFVAALNLSTDLPIKTIGKFIRPYVDLGYYFDNTISSNQQWLYSGGINLRIFRKVFNIYLPILHSKNIRELYTSAGSSHSYWKEVTFSLQITKPNFKNILTAAGFNF